MKLEVSIRDAHFCTSLPAKNCRTELPSMGASFLLAVGIAEKLIPVTKAEFLWRVKALSTVSSDSLPGRLSGVAGVF